MKLKTKKTNAPTTRRPTRGPTTATPTSSPTVRWTFEEQVSELLPKGNTPDSDPIGQWYYSFTAGAATATFVRLQDEVTSMRLQEGVCAVNPDKVSPNLVVDAPDCITSALRLYTGLADNDDEVEVGIKFYDGAANKGLFNGMTFQNMLTYGITFEYDFFKALVDDDDANVAAAPAIRMSIESPTIAGSSLTLVWEPYWGDCQNCPTDMVIDTDTWLSVSVDATTGENPNKGWWKTGSATQPPLKSLGEWAAEFDLSFMADAVVVYVGLAVGNYNKGVTSYVDSLRIATTNGYSWKWIFETNTATQTFT